MTRRLFITDAYDSRALDRAVAAASAGDTVDVLLLGLSPSWFRWQHATRAAAMKSCTIVEPACFADAARGEVRRFVVDFMAALPEMDLGGGETLARLLREPDGNVWWYLETSEKGPYRGPLIGQLHALAVARATIDAGGYTTIAHSVRDALIRESLNRALSGTALDDLGADANASGATNPLHGRPLARYAVNAALAAGRLMAAWALPRTDVRATMARGSRVIFSVFPAWWSNATGPNARERFFTVADDGRVAGYLALALPTGSLWRDRGAIRAAVARHRIVFLQHFLGIADLFALFAMSRFRRLVEFQRRWRDRVRAQFAGFEVGPLIARDIGRSLSGGETFQDLLLARAVRRAVDVLQPSTILYRAEFQPSENALLRGSEGRTTRIGFVHFPFGENYLPIRFAAGEAARYLQRRGDVDARPLPDGLIAGGEVMKEHVTATGFPASKVAICGPVRYDALVRYRQTQPAKADLRARLRLPADRLIVFVALAIVEADTEALFGTLMEALDGSTSGLRIVVRTHPNRPAGDPALRTTLTALGAERASLMPTDASIYDYIAASDAMVCIGSMIAFEAMALGVMPIVFDNPATFGAVSLAEYGDALFSVRTGAELRDAIQHATCDDAAATAKRQAWPRQLARVFGDLDRSPAEQLARAIDELSC